MTLRKRIEAIEAATAPREIAEIIIVGGLPGSDPFAQASFGAGLVEPDPDETPDAFKARVRACAKDAGAAWIVFGGLPENEQSGLCE